MSANISNQTDSKRNNRRFNEGNQRNSSIDQQSEERDSSPMRYSMIDLRNNNGLEDVQEYNTLGYEDDEHPRV